MAAENFGLATVVAKAIRDVDSSLILLSPAGSKLSRAGIEAGLVVAEEVFADRAYGDDGNLLPRSEPGAVFHSVQECVDQVSAFLDADAIVTQSGKKIPTDIQSICVHGDSPTSVSAAQAILVMLEERGVSVKTLAEVVSAS